MLDERTIVVQRKYIQLFAPASATMSVESLVSQSAWRWEPISQSGPTIPGEQASREEEVRSCGPACLLRLDAVVPDRVSRVIQVLFFTISPALALCCCAST